MDEGRAFYNISHYIHTSILLFLATTQLYFQPIYHKFLFFIFNFTSSSFHHTQKILPFFSSLISQKLHAIFVV